MLPPPNPINRINFPNTREASRRKEERTTILSSLGSLSLSIKFFIVSIHSQRGCFLSLSPFGFEANDRDIRSGFSVRPRREGMLGIKHENGTFFLCGVYLFFNEKVRTPMTKMKSVRSPNSNFGRPISGPTFASRFHHRKKNRNCRGRNCKKKKLHL